ncbi:MAG TPA: tetratricopeptide repeat protein [Pyrinomonadaceae bacterium]|nr:tetratricopeptide repeat protein [Pyrinomonadaceae bacterium]
MKFAASILLFLSLSAATGLGQTCSENAKEVRPQLSKEAELKMSQDLEIAARNAVADPTADNIIWYARRKGYLGRYKDAIDALTISLPKFPNDARFYRHRGHRYITLRCFDDAIRDFEKAAKLIKGKPDEVEPDGMPNAQNTPTSTLQSNIWYHLGLAYYLNGDFKKAIEAYKEGMKVSKNNDMLAAMSHWLYMAYRRSQKPVDAGRLLEPVNGDFEVIENDDYLKLLRLYRNEVKPEMLLESLGEKAETLGNASLGYGLGNWYLYNGDKVRAMNIFRKITAGNQWASFGFIAAEAELIRAK